MTTGRAYLLFLPLLLAVVPAGAFAGPSASPPNEKLAGLCEEFWQGSLEASPTTATSLGDKRFDDRLEDITPAGIARERKRLEGVLARAKAIPEGSLTGQDRLTRSSLITEVEDELAAMSCGFEEWTVDPLGGPQNEFMNLADFTAIDTPKDGENYVKRVKLMGPYLDAQIANLKRG